MKTNIMNRMCIGNIFSLLPKTEKLIRISQSAAMAKSTIIPLHSQTYLGNRNAIGVNFFADAVTSENVHVIDRTYVANMKYIYLHKNQRHNTSIS